MEAEFYESGMVIKVKLAINAQLGALLKERETES